MPRTTLHLEDDAKAHAVRHRLILGKAVSELVKQGAQRPFLTDRRNGLVVVRLNRRSPKVSSALIDTLRDELP